MAMPDTRVRNLLVCLFLAALAGGCSQQVIYPVHGRIVDPDGRPITGLKGGAVEFQSLEAKMSANASIDENGEFRLTTETAGDGAHLGKHRVAILRPYYGPEQPAPHLIHPKYESFDTSGLEAIVEPRDNQVELKVELYKRASQ
jgi:hypothetical protein